MPEPTRSLDDQSLLHDIQALERAVGDAVQAISENSLEALEESLFRQQLLCVTLQNAASSLAAGSGGARLQAFGASASGLQRLSGVYAQLLHQAHCSTLLILKLCRDYQDRALDELDPELAYSCSLEA